MDETRVPVGQIFLDAGYITKYQLKVAEEEREKRNLSLSRTLIQLEFLSRHEWLEVLGKELEVETVDLDDVNIPPEITHKLDYSSADMHQAVPVREEDGRLFVATSDPHDFTVLDQIRYMVEMDVEPLLADEESISIAIEKYYGQDVSSIEDMIDEIGGEGLDVVSSDDDIDDLAKLADSRPVVKMLDLILLNAIKDQGSDIHFEPYEDDFRIRYRVDGFLYQMKSPDKKMARALVTRIKLISKLDISESRLPQDGRIPLKIGGRAVDLRVSTVPTKFGESAVLRILDKEVVALDLNNLRMSEDELSVIKNIIYRPNGIVLVTGPTGSGKTTTLYASLNELNSPETKIITNEDPVEYNIDGLVQVPINPNVDMTYARSLRATMRQDPDIILVGEIRDKETADIAVEASLTGHLVFSTLHTNDAPSTITRLLDMGIENYLITATLEAIIAQRLVRTICTQCKKEYNPTADSMHELGLDPSTIDSSIIFYQGEGCDVCRGTRYKGRIALFEILNMNPLLREMILNEASTQEINEAAINSGMKTLREVGIEKIFAGLTTIDEVVRETVSI